MITLYRSLSWVVHAHKLATSSEKQLETVKENTNKEMEWKSKNIVAQLYR